MTSNVLAKPKNKQPAAFTFKQTPLGTAPNVSARSSNSSATGSTMPPGSVGSGTEPQFRSRGTANSSNTSNSSAPARTSTPTPLGYVKNVPVYWGESCGDPPPAGIVLRAKSITESQAQVMLIPSQGGTFKAVLDTVNKSERKVLEAGAETASNLAKEKHAGIFPTSATMSNVPRELVLVKVPKDDDNQAQSRMDFALQTAATTTGLMAPQHKTLATTWLGAGKADAGNIYSQAQLDMLCDWQQAQPGRTVEICDLKAKGFSTLCQHLSSPASLPDAQQKLVADYAKWMEKKDPPVKQLGWLKPPGGAAWIPVWAFAGKKGDEDSALIQGKKGMILAFDVDAMKLPDTAFLYAHKPGLDIGKKGMAGKLREMAEGGTFISDAQNGLKAANKGKELEDGQAVLVPVNANAPGSLKGKAVILVNGPKVGDATTTPEDAKRLEVTIDNAFEQARLADMRSVAVTGISTGEFGFDKLWGGNTIGQASLRALQAGTVDTVVCCMWVDKGLKLEQSVAGGALTALVANPCFEAI